MDSLENYLEKVTANMNATWHKYKDLEAKQNELAIPTQPIPFFGDIANAHVLTVGVNPSATEFDEKRDWQGEMSANELNDRLQSYFMSGHIKPHEWFDTWIEALDFLGASYQAGAAHLAAHIDLSPRATISMENAKKRGHEQLFKTMVEQDVKWFFQLLQQCDQTRLLFFAGCTADRYINDFVKRVASVHGFQLKGTLNEKNGKAKTGYYYLRGPGVDLPVFFCSISPSARTEQEKQMLIDRVKEHKDRILEFMCASDVEAV